jgi:hypothetical protein
MVQTTTRGFTTRCPVATAPTGPRLPVARPGRGSAEGTAQTHPRHPEARPGSGPETEMGVPRWTWTGSSRSSGTWRRTTSGRSGCSDACSARRNGTRSGHIRHPITRPAGPTRMSSSEEDRPAVVAVHDRYKTRISRSQHANGVTATAPGVLQRGVLVERRLHRGTCGGSPPTLSRPMTKSTISPATSNPTRTTAFLHPVAAFTTCVSPRLTTT